MPNELKTKRKQMKKNNILVTCVTLMTCVLLDANAQIVDQKKMNKDIAIAEDILKSMMTQDMERIYTLSGEPKGMYVPDYGVIFNISGSARSFSWGKVHEFGDTNFDFDFNFSDSFVVDTDELQRKAQALAVKAQKMAIENNENLTRLLMEKQKLIENTQNSEEAKEIQHEAVELQSEAEKISRDAERMLVEAELIAENAERKKKWENEEEDIQVEKEVHVIVAPNAQPNARVYRTQRIPRTIEGAKELDSASFRALMIDFLIDYSGLIGQLKSDQKIMVSSGMGGGRQFGRSNYSVKLTAEITKKDLDDYRKDKLSRERLIDKIKIEKTDDSKETFKDLELFSTILTRIYDTDLAETYYSTQRFINYEKLANYGVVYSMKVFSSVENNNRKYSLPTQKLNGLTFEERNKKVESLYPQFEEELKGNILDYGRTIKSLKPNETILFKVKLTECIKCNMPESIEVSVKQSVLQDYDSDKLSKSAALAKINIKKNIK